MPHQVHGYPQLHLSKAEGARPQGVITVEGSFEQAYYCEQDCVAQAGALITPYAPNGLGYDTGRASVKGPAKEAAALDQPSIGEAAKVRGGNNGSASPSNQALGPLEGVDPIEVSSDLSP